MRSRKVTKKYSFLMARQPWSPPPPSLKLVAPFFALEKRETLLENVIDKKT